VIFALLVLGAGLLAMWLRRLSKAQRRRWRRQQIERGELFRPLPPPGQRRR
jgi:hypothetical protein